jgi:hypothetical protein
VGCRQGPLRRSPRGQVPRGLEPSVSSLSAC